MRLRDREKQQTIRDRALELFFELGLAGFSMGKLARSAGVSPATLYIYYRDRDDLIFQICREEMILMNEAALEGFHPDMSFAEGLEVQWYNRARYYRENPLGSHFLEQMRFNPYYYEEVTRSLDPRFHRAMQHFVRGAIDRGELVDLPVEVYWSVAFGPLYQLLKMDLHKTGFPGMRPFTLEDEGLKQALELVIRGLTPPSLSSGQRDLL